MEMQSKKDQWNKSEDRKKGFQPLLQAICFDLDFCCFLILSLFSLHLIGSLWDYFLVKFKCIAFEFNFY